MSLKLHFQLGAQSVDHHNVHSGDNIFLIILKHKDHLFESPSICWRVYIPPHCVFFTYRRAFRTCPVCKQGNTCVYNSPSVKHFLTFSFRKFFIFGNLIYGTVISNSNWIFMGFCSHFRKI